MHKTVLILRHGKSRHGPEYATDFERPLAPRGQKAAKRMAEYMIQRDIVPELILSSPATRARDTAYRVQKKLAACPIQLEPEIYSGDVLDIVSLLRAVPEEIDTCMVVGHNPTLEMLSEYLGSSKTVMKTCSLAVLESGPTSWDKVSAAAFRLSEVVHPRELD